MTMTFALPRESVELFRAFIGREISSIYLKHMSYWEPNKEMSTFDDIVFDFYADKTYIRGTSEEVDDERSYHHMCFIEQADPEPFEFEYDQENNQFIFTELISSITYWSILNRVTFFAIGGKEHHFTAIQLLLENQSVITITPNNPMGFSFHFGEEAVAELLKDSVLYEVIE